MGRQVVDDDDVAALERWPQRLFKISEEGGSGHWAIYHKGCNHLVIANPSHEGNRLPMPLWHATDQSLAALISRSPRRQRPRSRTMLVEVEVSWINTRRAGSNIPCSRIQRRRARATSARSCSAARRLFFLKLIPWRVNNRQTALRLPAIRRLRIATTISSSVKSGCLVIRVNSQSACTSKGEMLPPIGLAATLLVSSQRCSHFTPELALPWAYAANPPLIDVA